MRLQINTRQHISRRHALQIGKLGLSLSALLAAEQSGVGLARIIASS